MRLTSIKLAGFKSFVDPTTLELRSNLVAIVGPNGCGKSNVIDAIRWVMGESSAGRLRGEAMSDVIFAGSNSRKPVTQASVELIFDNSDGSLGGVYAEYTEISVRRQVSRDGSSAYFLNGTRCRRRDITDLFLGTGLGARSYAIIEQGMISALIEARPEELRNHLEEAAGISRYKERRRETESRIASTRENLDRLKDLRDEIGKQLEHLERQARQAERYQALKAEQLLKRYWLENQVKATIDAEAAEQTVELTQAQALLTESEGACLALQARIDELRTAHQAAVADVGRVQGELYQVQGLIAQIEQAQRHARDLAQRRALELSQRADEKARIETELSLDHERLALLASEAQRTEARRQSAEHEHREAQQQLQRVQQELEALLVQLGDVEQAARTHERMGAVARSRLEGLEREGLLRSQRRATLTAEAAELSLSQTEVEPLDARIATLDTEVTDSAQALAALDQQLAAARAAVVEAENTLGHDERAAAEAAGRLQSLRELLKAALDQGSDPTEAFLITHGLPRGPALYEVLKVNQGFETAVESVLQALFAARLMDPKTLLEALPTGLKLISDEQSGSDEAPAHSLARQVQGPSALCRLLRTIEVVDDLATALAARASLDDQRWLVTRNGELITRAFVLGRQRPASARGALEIKREQDTAAEQQRLLGLKLANARSWLHQARSQRETLEQQRRELASHRAQLTADLASAQSRRRALADQAQRIELRQAQVARELTQNERELDGQREAITSLRGEIQSANEALATASAKLAALKPLRHQQELSLGRVRELERGHARVLEQTRIELGRIDATRRELLQAVERASKRLAQIATQQQALLAEVEAEQAPAVERLAALERHLAQRSEVERSLALASDHRQGIETQLAELETERHRVDVVARQAAVRVRDSELRLASLKTRAELAATTVSQLREQYAEPPALPPETMASDHLLREVAELDVRIRRLEPVNLAAISEHGAQAERLAWLNAQHEDLIAALSTLEEAIAKIDRETRTRFRETFERVNSGLKTLFPRLFGGGHGYLQLTNDDLLHAGVEVLARPPGKRVAHLSLLSGGEKALTAVALVFAIFELNPAPFCLLDEVDAPLDEANVGRFTQLVRDMSEQLQFVVVTHNKLTMEMAQQLVGVTMREPGVSRLVAVDLAEAERYASA